MTQKSNTLEGLANGTPLTQSNMGGASGDQPVLVTTNSATAVADNTHPAHGVMGIKFTPTATGVCYVYYAVDGPICAARIYMWLTALPTADTGIIYLRTAAAGKIMYVTLNANGALRFSDTVSTNIWTATNPVPINTMVRYDAYVNVSASQAKVAYATIDGAATEDSGLKAVNVGTTNVGLILLGKVTGVYATVFWADDPKVDDAATGYITPGTASALTPVGMVITPAGALAGGLAVPFTITAVCTVSGGNGGSKVWGIDWGDGSTDYAATNSLNQITATHEYAVGPADYTVTWTCTQ